MNALDFAIKQAHLTALKFTRADAALVNLTPARIHLLRRLLVGRDHALSQADLRRNLGVTAPVVSIMVRALESLGYVSRTKDPDDRRTWLVKLTPLAESTLRFVQWMTHVQSHYRLAQACVFSRDSGVPAKGWKKTVNRLRKRLDGYVERLGRDGIANPWDYIEDEDDFYNADVPDNPILYDLIPVDWEDNFVPGEGDDPHATPMTDLLIDTIRAGMGHPDSDEI